MNNVIHSLSTMDCEKYLGVWITSTSQPSIQCQKSYSKAMQLQSLATIKRTSLYQKIPFVCFTKLTYVHMIYIAFKFGIHSYCTKDIDFIEKIQHRPTKFVPELSNIIYAMKSN